MDIPVPRSSPKSGTKREEVEGATGISRPVARRGQPLSSSPPENAALLRPGASKPVNHLSAWTKYQSPATSHSPPNEMVAPPPDTDASLATQAAAQQMWEQATVPDSDNTSTSPPSDSPPAPRATLDTTILQNMLNSLQGSAGALNPIQAMQIQDAYLTSIRTVLQSSGDNNTISSNQEQRNQEPPPRGTFEASQFSNGFRLPEGILSRPIAERVNGNSHPHAANGSLSILPESSHRSLNGFADPSSRQQGRLPPNSTFHPPQNGSANNQVAGMTPQQVMKLLEEALRAQGPAAGHPPAFQQHNLPVEHLSQPMMGMNALSYPSFARYGNQEPSYREHSVNMYPASLDMEQHTHSKMAQRCWNSCASMLSESSFFNPSASFTPPSHIFPGSIPPNLTGPESQAFLQALQQRCQAHEMEAVANARIQQILAGSSNRDDGMRKRKLPDFYDDLPRRHNSMMSDGENYYTHPQILGGPQQVCTECGTTNTPTWRRSGKRLMCNACGLRRSRSVRSARCNSMPMSPGALRQEPPPASSPKML